MNKAITGKNYGSIPHLLDSKLGKHDKYLHKGQDAIIRKGGRNRHDMVHASLKIDGTNVGVLRQGEDLIPLQRKGYDCRTSPYKQHHKFAEFVDEHRAQFFHLLNDGERVVGEWIYQASGIIYNVECLPFLPFDLFSCSQRIPWAELVIRVATNSDFETPPSISYGYDDAPKGHAEIMKIIGPPCMAIPVGVQHEGLVYRVEKKGMFDFMGKWVRSDFIPGKYLPGVGLPGDSAIVNNHLL
jgi:hypothetical protein